MLMESALSVNNVDRVSAWKHGAGPFLISRMYEYEPDLYLYQIGTKS